MKKIGRNDKCPCGSGLKYKKCCLNKSLGSLMLVNLESIMIENHCTKEMADAVYFLLDFIERHNWRGACHIVSSVLYVFFSELNMSPKICIGEVKSKQSKPFDHSWVTINNKVIDITIQRGIDNENADSPVLFDVCITNMKYHEIKYGIYFMGLDSVASHIYNSMFVDYIDSSPMISNFRTWDLIIEMLKIVKYKTSINELKAKYSSTKRDYIRTFLSD